MTVTPPAGLLGGWVGSWAERSLSVQVPDQCHAPVTPLRAGLEVPHPGQPGPFSPAARGCPRLLGRRLEGGAQRPGHTYTRWESRGAAAGRSRPARTGCGSSCGSGRSRGPWCCAHTRTAGCPRARSTGWRAGYTCTCGDTGTASASPGAGVGGVGLTWQGPEKPQSSPDSLLGHTQPKSPPAKGSPWQPLPRMQATLDLAAGFSFIRGSRAHYVLAGVGCQGALVPEAVLSAAQLLTLHWTEVG